MAANPFKPTAGKMPPILIGRQGIIEDFAEGIDNGAGAPGRLMLVTGQRGYGKTVMLTELGRVAEARGWDVISETASEGLCGRLIESLAKGGVRLRGLSLAPTVSLPGVTASLGGASFSASEQGPLTLRDAIEARLRKLAPGRGIAFTIDEAQAASMEDMVALATALQHVIRDEDMRDVSDEEKHGVAFVFAALPSLMDELLHERVLTFLRRSMQRDLGNVPIPDVRLAYIESVTESGKTIDDATAFEAARQSVGYPYMIQLVGYYMWRSAEARSSRVIEIEDVNRGVTDALWAFDDAVCAPLFDGLTTAQRAFAGAMAADYPEPARTSDIGARVRRSSSWVSKYRASLIKEQVIEPAGYGMVRFAVPHLGDYLKNRSRAQ